MQGRHEARQKTGTRPTRRSAPAGSSSARSRPISIQRLRDVGARRPARHHLGRTPWRWRSCPTRWSSRRWCRWRAGTAGAARPIRRARLRGLHLGRRHLGVGAQGRRGLDLAHHHQPPDHRRQAVARRSTTSPTAASSSTSSPAGCSPRSRCSASRCSATRTATPAPRNGSPSSSGCGPRTSRSTTKAATSRSRKAIWRRSRSSTPTRRS